MEIKLRPTQTPAFEKIIATDLDRLLLVADTGWGKTELSLALVQHWLSQGRTITFIAHRKGLIDNASARCDRYAIEHFVLDGETKKDIPTPTEPFRIVSVQTLVSRSSLYEWMLEDILILDEAHETTFFDYIKKSWDKPHFVLGMTATPWRLKKTESLADFYKDMVPTMLPRELIEQRWRVPFVYFTNPNIKLDTLERGNTATGYKPKSVSITVDRPEVHAAAIENWLNISKGRKTLAFCCDVKHTENLCAAFNAAGIPANIITGKTPTGEFEKDSPKYRESRQGIIESLEKGEILVLCSCDTMKAGVDIPCVEAILDVAPSLSKAGVYQSHGRGSRLYEGKTECLILDMVGNVMKHGMVQDYTWEDYALRPAKKKGDGVAPYRVCDQCNCVCHPTKMVCPNCGNVFPLPERQIATGNLVLKYGNYRPEDWKPSGNKNIEYYQYLKRRVYLSQKNPKRASDLFRREKGFYPHTSDPMWDLGAIFQGAASTTQRTAYCDYLVAIAKKEKKTRSWIESEFIKEFGSEVGSEFFHDKDKYRVVWNQVLSAIDDKDRPIVKAAGILVSFDGDVAFVGANNSVFDRPIRARTPSIAMGFEKALGYPVKVEFAETTNGRRT